MTVIINKICYPTEMSKAKHVLTNHFLKIVFASDEEIMGILVQDYFVNG